jgi:DNA-binding beta-propeller fold protein YncE
LARLRKTKAVDVITNGRAASQMPGFGDTLSADQISALTDYLYDAPDETPTWNLEDARGSQVSYRDEAQVSNDLAHDADPLNLFVVVESGDHHVTILDGDRFEPLTRFQSRYALHGGAKFSPNGRYTYLASRDGWISKYDLWRLEMVAEVRAGINTRNVAVSPDGRYLVVGNYLPQTLMVLDAETLMPLQKIEVIGGSGTSSRVSAVYSAPPRDSLIVALKDVPEVWELRLGDTPTPADVRVITVAEPLDDFFFDHEYKVVIGAARGGSGGKVINLETGTEVAQVALEGMPHLGSGIYWTRQGREVFATPHLKANKISVIDMVSWETTKEIATGGPGFFMRSHADSPYIWADVFFGPDKDLLYVIGKQSLEIVKTLQPSPGLTAAHVEFNKQGTHALVSVLEQEGALIVYDAQTLEEVKRLPMRRPVGKYNVHNKITFSEGTSH